MSSELKALGVFSLFFLFRIHSINLIRAQSLSPLDYEFPEIDGSAVDDTCRFFSNPDTTTQTETTPPPVTTQQVVTTTEKPTVQMPETTGASVAPQPNPAEPNPAQPNPAGPIPDSQSDLAARLLAYLLANSRGHGADSLNRFFSQPIGGPRYHGYSVTSDSDEMAPTPVKNLNGNRWKIGLSSSDSSDES